MKYTKFTGKGPRKINEDSFNIVSVDDKRTLFVVCDGMGGHSHGEVASQTVCDAFSSFWIENSNIMDSEQKVQKATKVACAKLDEKSGRYLMGTTLVMCSIEGYQAVIAHAGDSRCYVVDTTGNIKYRTIDHIEFSSISLPYINKSFFTSHPEKAVPDIKIIKLQSLDRILLCSDGLYNTVNDETLLYTLQCAKNVEQVADKYRSICQKNACDNYTAIVIEIE